MSIEGEGPMRPDDGVHAVENNSGGRAWQPFLAWLADYGLDHYLNGAGCLAVCTAMFSCGWLVIELVFGNIEAAHRHFELIGKIGMTVALVVPLCLQIDAWRRFHRRPM